MVVYYSCATYRIVIGIYIPAPRIFPFMTSQTSQDTSNKFNALGEKSIPKLLVQYSLPAIIAMVVSSLYNIIDGIFIGQAVGADAISGLALTNPLMAISAAFGAMVGIGGSTLMSIRLGQKDYKAGQCHCAQCGDWTYTRLGFGAESRHHPPTVWSFRSHSALCASLHADIALW